MKYSDSSSEYQMVLESTLFDQTKHYLGTDDLQKNPKLLLSSDASIHIVPDFYSNKNLIIGEIHAHAGKLKGSQPDKIAFDVLKMLLYDKSSARTHKKFIVVCDHDEYVQLTGKSALAEAIRQFDVKVLYFDIGPERHNALVTAMRKQNLLPEE